jgi:hypothetical protein
MARRTSERMMADRDTGNRPLLPLPKAAEFLHLSVEAVQAMVEAGYLSPSRIGIDGPEFPLVDLKAFLARNADNGSGNDLLGLEFDGEPQALLDALGRRCDEMARRSYDI